MSHELVSLAVSTHPRHPATRSSLAGDEPHRKPVIALALAVTICAAAGAVALVVAGAGNRGIPHELLSGTPFDTFLIPGLLLGVVVGGSSLACAILAWRRSRGAVEATLVAGGALTVWIVVESIIVPASWLQGVFGALGLALVVLGVRGAWRSREARHRWLIAVTAAETIGYLAPSLAGIFATRAGWTDDGRAIAVTAAGFVEGFALGAGQGWAFPVPVRRMRFALLTSLGAGLVWAMVMSMMRFAPSLPLLLAIGVGALAVPAGLASVGTAQWIELRHHTTEARAWVAWTALAWIIALPLSFTPGPFVDETTPLASHVVLWGCGGLLMAFAMALVTWQGVRRCRARAASPWATMVR
jgi:hypothetical protein